MIFVNDLFFDIVYLFGACSIFILFFGQIKVKLFVILDLFGQYFIRRSFFFDDVQGRSKRNLIIVVQQQLLFFIWNFNFNLFLSIGDGFSLRLLAIVFLAFN